MAVGTGRLRGLHGRGRCIVLTRTAKATKALATFLKLRPGDYKHGKTRNRAKYSFPLRKSAITIDLLMRKLHTKLEVNWNL